MRALQVQLGSIAGDGSGAVPITISYALGFHLPKGVGTIPGVQYGSKRGSRGSMKGLRVKAQMRHESQVTASVPRVK